MESIIDIVNNKIVFNNNKIDILTDKENNPWFKAKDIAKILGYLNSKKAIKDHVREKHRKTYANIRGNEKGLPLNTQPHTIYISEPGMYSLILKSHMPIALQFQDWVLEEVLPAIRKYGEYKLESKY